MAETSFPVAGGAGVTDAAYERLMGPITGSGRYGFGVTASQFSTPLIFADNSGRQVKAYANQSAIVRGFRWESGTTPPVLALDANTSGNPRLDLIVLRLDRSNFTVRLGKTKGTPAAVPAAPAAIQDAGTSGVYELPVATVRVTSSGTTGQPSILAGDVTPLDWWLAPPPVTTASTRMPPASHGQVVHQYDTGRVMRAVGNTYVAQSEIGAWTKLSVGSGWSTDAIYAQRVNGMTYLQAFAALTGTTRDANQDTNLLTLPAAFRPAYDTRFTSWMTPGQPGLCTVSASTGAVTIASFPQAFPTGGQIAASVVWPSA